MDVSRAIQELLDSLSDALSNTKADGARAFENGEFEKAQTAALQGKAIESILESAKAIARQWEGFDSAPAATAPEKPAPRKRKEKEESVKVDVVLPILQALEDAGGKGDTEQILDRVERLIKDRLTPADYELLPDHETVRWRESVGAVRKEMVRKGFIYSNSAEGVWQITPQGRLYLFEQK
jgi:hypothetical protein